MRGLHWVRRGLIGVAVLLAIMSSEARAAWRVVGQMGGPISAVAASGDIAYVGVGARVVIYDIAAPASAREIGSSIVLAEFISNLTVSGSRLYVAAGTAGVYVFDIDHPAGLRLVGRWDSPGSAESVAVIGDLAYVADGPFGLQIVDLSNPSSPVPRGAAFDMRFAFDVLVEGQHAFVAGAGAGLLVADISDAARPREVATLDTPGFARALALSGSALYLADQWGGVRVVDVADPGRPRQTASVELPSWAFDVAVTASTLFVADGARGLRLYSASDPQRGELGSYEIPSQVSWRVAVAGDRALVAARAAGVHIIDTRAEPRRLGLIAPVSNVQSVVVRDQVAFLGTGDQGLRIVDISDPARPVERGGAASDRGWAVLADETRAYFCNGMSPPSHRLRVFDIANLERPAEVAAIRISAGICRDLVRDGQWLYMPNEFGVLIFDLSNRDAPSPVGAVVLPTADGTHGSAAGGNSIAPAGTVAFVPNAVNGIATIDISDPRDPRRIGGWSSTDPPVSAGDVDAQNGFAYVVSGLPTPEFIVLDARDPARPVRRGGALLPEPGQQVVVRGSQAYVADGASGVIVFDVANPAAPRELERIATPGYANRLSLSGSRMVVAAGDGGLYILESASAAGAPVRTTSARRRVDRVPRASYDQPRAVFHATPSNSVVERETPIQHTPSAAGRSIVISSPSDSGPGTLRDALANLQADDSITFDPGVFPPNNPARIRPASPLPRITRDRITIDASNAGVILDGSALSGQFDSGLSIASSGNTVKGLQILDFPNAGITITGNGGNTIGGDRGRGSGPSGEGNVLSRNRASGITVLNPNGNRIVGNRIGTDAAGRIALGRQDRGIWIFHQPGNGDAVSGDWIGGFQPWEANVIAGNVLNEINLQNTSGHRLVGNYVGTDPSGATRVGAAHTAISMGVAADNVLTGNVIVGRNHPLFLGDAGSCCNQIVGNWIGVTKGGTPIVRDSESTGVNILESFNLVANNMIGGMQYGGVSVNGYQAVATETVIIGNRVGTGLGGPRPERWGISLGAAARTFIGGATDAERNVISGNDLGIWLTTPGVERTFVLGNFIGVDAASQPFRNAGNGIDLGRATLSFVQGNVVAENAGHGVVVSGARNRLRRNSIFANARGGIAVTGGGVPAAPIIQSASASTAAGTACARCTVEIYSDDREQGRVYEGATIADAGGQFSFAKPGPMRGPSITALATDSSGGTSAFSAAQRSGSAASFQSLAARAGGAAAASPPDGVLIPVPGPAAVGRTSVQASMAPIVRDTRSGLDTTIAVTVLETDPVDVVISLREPGGNETRAGRRFARLPGRTRWAASVGQLFPDADTTSFRGTVIISGSGPVAATTIQGGPLGESMPVAAVPVDSPSGRDVWFPYFAAGPGLSSSLTVMNPVNAINSGEIAFHDLAGNPLPVDLGGPRPASRFVFTLPPYGSTIVTASVAGPTVIGSAVVTSGASSIGAAAAFGSAAEGSASAPGETGSAIAVPVTRSAAAGLTTLVAIVSTGRPATVRLALVDAAGRQMGAEKTVVLPPHGQQSDFVEHLFNEADTREFEGRVLVSADTEIAVTGIRARPQ